jgi:hypothetical protein
VKLVDQWLVIETNLPHGWDEARLTLVTEQPAELTRAAQVLAPMNPGRVGESLVLHVRRAGGAAGPEAARRLFGRLDGDRVWCLLSLDEASGETSPAPVDLPVEPGTGTVVDQWDAALLSLPSDWSDLLGELTIESSDFLPRAALLCAPLNPTRDPGQVGFTFRCSGGNGYGVSPSMARRCFERLVSEGIVAHVTVLRVLADTHNVATQGPVWLVDGRVL